MTSEELEGLGFSRASIRRRTATGRWSKVDRGVIRFGGAPVTWESQVLACALAAGPGAVASHRTAAALWELDGCRPGPPELSVPVGRWHRRPGARSHRSTDLDRVRPTRRSGIPTTPIDRTLLDLCAVAGRTTVRLAIDDARRRGLTDWDRLLTCLFLHARRGRTGVGRLPSVLDEHLDAVRAIDTGFERLVYVRLVEAGLPRPMLQHEIVIDGKSCRPDLAYPAAKLAIELDGSIHLRRDVWERDHARQNVFVLAGWAILRFTWRDYLHHQTRMVRERAALERLGR